MIVQVECPDCAAKQINESKKGMQWCSICGWKNR